MAVSIHEPGGDQTAARIEPFEGVERMPLRLDLAVDVVLPAHGQDASAPRRHAHVSAG